MTSSRILNTQAISLTTLTKTILLSLQFVQDPSGLLGWLLVLRYCLRCWSRIRYCHRCWLCLWYCHRWWLCLWYCHTIYCKSTALSCLSGWLLVLRYCLRCWLCIRYCRRCWLHLRYCYNQIPLQLTAPSYLILFEVHDSCIRPLAWQELSTTIATSASLATANKLAPWSY